MTAAGAQRPYEMEIDVRPSDIDHLGHASNVVYLRWVQDVATAHWYAAATERQKSALLWMLAKHEVEYRRPAYEQDGVIVRTWVGKATQRAFERHAELLRKSDRKLRVIVMQAIFCVCPTAARKDKTTAACQERWFPDLQSPSAPSMFLPSPAEQLPAGGSGCKQCHRQPNEERAY